MDWMLLELEKELRSQSNMVMEDTFTNDPQTKLAYIYDYYHDDEPLIYRNLKPQLSKSKIPVEIKYIADAHQTLSKDQVSFHIQFRPSFDYRNEPGLSYYFDEYEDKYGFEFPMGVYLDIPDNKGRYRKWLVVGKAETYGTQFSSWNILPVDYVFEWIDKGTIRKMCGCLRSQNSYMLCASYRKLYVESSLIAGKTC